MSPQIEQLVQSIELIVKRIGELNREGYEMGDTRESLRKVDEELNNMLFNLEE